MEQPQKEQPSKRMKINQILDIVMLADLANCTIEILESIPQDVEEPFERYAHQLRMRLYQESTLFCSRFIHGYESLLEQLQSGES